ncbi:MAG: carbohydrate-binding protein [Clostridiales bacterium]|nr:carbohydrate-binding protein [Clostridiales bacterium]
MKQNNKLVLVILLCMSIVSTLFTTEAEAAVTITSNETGTHGGYDYELWKDSGNTSMTLNDGGTFSCEWSNINNALFRKGKKYNETQTHQQIGDIKVKYGCDYQPNGNSYLCVYGWTVDPLVEYYIVDSWGNWRPPGAQSKGTITVDGGTYDIYETTRENQPSIKGTATFQQYWSVRTSKRTSGTISVSDHFKAWESRGMRMGKMYEVAFTVEGYQSSGKANVHTMSVVINGTDDDDDEEVDYGVRSAFKAIEAEEFNTTTSSTLETIGTGMGGDGIGYIESGDTITYRDIDFGSGGVSTFSAIVASEQNTNIQIRLGKADGTLLGTLTDVSTGGWDDYETRSTKVSNVTGKQDIVLVFSGPVNVDSFIFSLESASSKGDVNGDGDIDAIDFSILKSYVLRRDSLLDEEAADINSDGQVDSLDLSLLKSMLLNK